MRISDWSSDVCSSDLTIRPGTTHEALAQLKLAFRSDEMCARFPEIQWGVTAGNASQITDGAAALLLVSERAAKRLGLRPRARFVGFDVIADAPLMMLTAPIPARSEERRVGTEGVRQCRSRWSGVTQTK